MANFDRSWRSLLLKLLLLSSFSFLASADSNPSRSSEGYPITGRIKIDGISMKGYGSGKIANAKIILNGGQSVAFIRPDGYFTFSRFAGKVQAALTENRRALTELVLEPLREEQYYEVREPFTVWSLLKNPMGLMVGFMLIVVFIMPKLVENMDPEEMRQAQEQMRSQGIPSLSNLLPANNR